MLVLKKSEIIAGNTHGNIVETSQFIDSAGAGGTWGHELAVEQDAYTYPNGEHKVYTLALPGLYDITPGTFDGHPFTSIDLGAFRWNGSAWVFTHTQVTLNNAQKFRAVYGSIAPGDNQANGDKSHINPLFWQAAVRSVGGTRKVCTIHDCRPDSGTDTDGIIQYYVITPNNYPGGTPGKAIGRYNPTYGWVHDSSIAMNGCGDIAISYTRSGRDNSNNAIYPQFWRWLIPSAGTSTKSLVQAGPSQYLDGQGWADFNQMAADPSDPTQFFALHILVHDDTTCGCSHHSTWAGWVAKYTIAGCGQRPGGGDGAGRLWALLDFLEAARSGDEEADLDGDGEVTAMDYLLAREMLEGAGP